MIPEIDNPAILALYADRKPQPAAPESQPAAVESEPQFARAPEGNGHEEALRLRGGAR